MTDERRPRRPGSIMSDADRANISRGIRRRIQDAVPVQIDLEDTGAIDEPIPRIEARQRNQSKEMASLGGRLERIEDVTSQLTSGLAKSETRIESVDGKLDTLLAAEIADRRTRADRAETAAVDLARAKATAEEDERRRAHELRRTSGAAYVTVAMKIIAAITTITLAYLAGSGAL